MIKEYKNQITALVIVLLLVGGYVIVNQSKLAEQKRLAAEKAFNEKLADLNYEGCVATAEDSYWTYMEMNGTGKRLTGVRAQQRYWDNAEREKQNAINNCYKQYK